MPQIQGNPNGDESLASEMANETVEADGTLPKLLTIPMPGKWKMDLWSATW